MSLEITEETKGLMYSTWLPAITTTVLEGIKGLPAKHRKAILTNMCDTCGNLAMAGAVGIQPGMSWDEYVKFLEEAAPPIGRWAIKRSGDVFDLVYETSIGPDGRPRCHCPLILLGMIAQQFPECCASGSGARLGAHMIEAATRKPVAKATVIDCPTKTGASVCHYRVWLKGSSSPKKEKSSKAGKSPSRKRLRI